jgi:hypothetical protein
LERFVSSNVRKNRIYPMPDTTLFDQDGQEIGKIEWDMDSISTDEIELDDVITGSEQP